MNHDSRIYDEPDLDYDVFTEGPWTVPLSTLRELPYGCKCRVCRSSFRSKKARDGYCFSCRQIIEDRTKELDQILVHAAHSPGEQQKAIARVRALLTCPILAVGWRIRCDWAGNAARQWPETIAGFRRVLRVFVERHLRHVWQEHCSPARFGRASQRRERILTAADYRAVCRNPSSRFWHALASTLIPGRIAFPDVGFRGKGWSSTWQAVSCLFLNSSVGISHTINFPPLSFKLLLVLLGILPNVIRPNRRGTNRAGICRWFLEMLLGSLNACRL